MLRVLLPGPLVAEAGGCSRVDLTAPHATVGEALAELFARHPALRLRIVDEQGRVRPHVNVFVGDDSIRFERGLDTPLRDGASISVLPAVSGG
jgi:molybdopterin converting factor small subunit